MNFFSVSCVSMWKGLRGLITAALLVSIAWSARELLAIAKFAKDFSAHGLSTGDTLAKAVLPAESMAVLTTGFGKIEQPQLTATTPSVSLPQSPSSPRHVAGIDTNSAPGQIVSGRQGPSRTTSAGGGVIMNADGTQIEIIPPSRPRPPAPLKNSKLGQFLPDAPPLPALNLPIGSANRKTRAQILLIGSVIAAFGLIFWARRWRP